MADPAQPLRFTKMHGAGNDFVVLDLRDGGMPPAPELCRRLADRHTGVGCDQILTVEPPRDGRAHAAYGIWNADGSAARQCGNGARCVAEWLAQTDRIEGALTLDSPAGTHRADPLGEGRWRIAMGVPVFAAERIPLRAAPDAQGAYALDLDDGPLRFGAVSLGNPHAVVTVTDVDAAPVARIGRALQRHPAFPESVNVGFADVIAPDRLRLRVYERGVGETLACGSGACAAAAVLIRAGRVERRVAVQLPGGTLEIDWPADDAPMSMAGPTAFVFDGHWLSP